MLFERGPLGSPLSAATQSTGGIARAGLPFDPVRPCGNLMPTATGSLHRKERTMNVVGLTGGIASGKSTVSRILRELGAEVIDADQIARNVVRQGTPAWKEIRDHFGTEILLPDGEIDRAALGDLVFHDPAQKEALNGIVHPRVITEYAQRIAELEKTMPEALVIMDVPLLFESGMHEGLQDIIVVYVPIDLQLQRLRERDRLSREDALARIHSQMPLDKKAALATHLIDNSGTPEHTLLQTRRIFDILQQ